MVVSPVDALVSEAGVARGGRLVQAKGIDYTASALVGDERVGARLDGGSYATLYLSPRDYHRIHFPLPGRVLGWRYVPGTALAGEPGLGAERPGALHGERAAGHAARFAARPGGHRGGGRHRGGARAGHLRPGGPGDQPAGARAQSHDYPSPLPVEKGQELGAFEMGSTVILLFEPGRVAFAPALVPGARVRVGEAIGGRAV